MLPWFKRLFSRVDTSPQSIGVMGEREATVFLKSKGYSILARNWRSGKDEIDLICDDEGVLVFVETRTRKKGALVGGYDSIDKRKRDALRRVCRAYLGKLRPKPRTYRFDVVEVEHDAGTAIATRHFENAPLFSKAMGRGR